MTKSVLLFVYGTLKKGHYNHERFGFEDLNFVGKAIVPNFALVQEKTLPYPFMINESGHQVIGEVYEVDMKLLERLDRMEVGAGYFQATTKTTDGVEVRCFIDQTNRHPKLKRFSHFELPEEGKNA